MIRLSIALLVGVFALQLGSIPPRIGCIVGVFVALTLLLPWLRRGDLSVVLVGGILFYTSAANVIESRLDARFAGDSMLVAVRVDDFPRDNGRSTSFVATATDDQRLRGRVRLSWFDPPVPVRLGDVWRLELRLRRPRSNSNPGSMDYEAWLFRNRIAASGYVVDSKHNLLLDSATATGIDLLRQRYVRRLQKHLHNDNSIAVLAAIVVGARHLIAPEQWDRYSATGTSHLMAISGLHVGLAAAGSYVLTAALLGLFVRHRNQRHVALVIAVIVALVYAIVSGFAVPAQRATIMLVLATIVVLRLRQVSPGRVLAAAAAIVVITDPLSTMSPGFKLSFAAVALLSWFMQAQMVAGVGWLLRPLLALRSLAFVQVLLLVGLLPLTVLIFDRASLAAPMINLIAVPLFSVITVPLALLSLILDGALAFAGDIAMRAAAASIDWLEWLIAIMASVRHSPFIVADLNGFGWLYLLLPLMWVLLPSGWPGRFVAWLGLVSLLCWRPAGTPPRCVDVDILDVGQGLAVIVQSRAHTLVYDSGPSYRSGGSAATRVLLPFLASKGIRLVDRLIISHSDLDHAGGTQALRENIVIDDIISGEPLPAPDLAAGRCLAGSRWEWDEVRFSILHPALQSIRTGNDASCVLLIETGEHRILLTGDIEAGVEADLVRRRQLPTVDVVTVPHHGSRTSSIAAFVRSLMPDIAIVSAAAGNQWGFPKPEVVARWQSYGANVLNTATSGAIGLRMCANDGVMAVTEHRKVVRRLWHDGP